MYFQNETYAAIDAVVGSRALNNSTEVNFSFIIISVDCRHGRSVGCRPSYWRTMNQVLDININAQQFKASEGNCPELFCYYNCNSQSIQQII